MVEEVQPLALSARSHTRTTLRKQEVQLEMDDGGDYREKLAGYMGYFGNLPIERDIELLA